MAWSGWHWWMVNIGLPGRSGSDRFREAVTIRWMAALEAFAPQPSALGRSAAAQAQVLIGAD